MRRGAGLRAEETYQTWVSGVPKTVETNKHIFSSPCAGETPYECSAAPIHQTCCSISALVMPLSGPWALQDQKSLGQVTGSRPGETDHSVAFSKAHVLHVFGSRSVQDAAVIDRSPGQKLCSRGHEPSARSIYRLPS